MERQFVSNYMLLRHKAVEAIAKRPIVEPKKIGTMSDGMKALYGVDSFWDMVKQNDERPRNKTGCLIPLLVLLASATAACAMAAAVVVFPVPPFITAVVMVCIFLYLLSPFSVKHSK